MLTTFNRSGYRALFLALTAMLLAACSAKPVFHEFPQPFAADARPPSAVAYTLRETEAGSGDWIMRGGQGGAVGTFRWRPSFRAPDASGTAPDRSEDFRRDDRFQDGVNEVDYLFRLGATSDNLNRSSGWGTAPPRVTIFNVATGERVGELELRIGFDHRFEGTWRDRAILWRTESLREIVMPRETDTGRVEDHYPAAQLLQWAGGSNANLRIYTGRTIIMAEPPGFGAPIFDITAGRPLTRRERGDVVVLLFAIRALEQAAGLANTLGEQ